MSSTNQACAPCAPRGPNKSCPVVVGDEICGETNSLEIMKEFNRMYEERMERMDNEAADECFQEKIKLQQDWIRNLTQQNEMLVRAVQELEFEATQRVQQLEEKLHKSAQCLCEVMKKYRENDYVADLLGEPLQKIARLEHDLATVLEFVRRARENKNWTLDDLFFYNVSKQELMGGTIKKSTFEDSNEGEKLLMEKDQTVAELSAKIGNVDNLSLELEMRRKECDSLKQEMADMRQVLTEEVATRHDQTVALKKETQQLEERCVQADKQIQFKEDIIKELRKEIKQLQLQVCIPEKPSSSDEQSRTLTKSDSEKPPYIVVNHSSRKHAGKNTVIYINQDGTVRREVTSLDSKGGGGPLLAIGYKQDHAASCGKCKGKFTASDTDLTKRQQRGDVVERFVPVKMHVDQIERGTNF